MRANFAPPPAPAPGPVLLLVNSLGMGGSEAKSIRLANSLVERGIKVVLAYLSPPESLRGEVSPDVDVVHLARQGKFSWRASTRLVETIHQRGVAVVVTYNLYPALYATLARLRLGRSAFRLMASINTTDVMTRSMARRMPLYRWVLKHADTIIFGAEIQRRLWQERYRIGTAGVPTEVLYNGVDTQRFAALPDTTRLRPHAPRTRFVIGTVGRLRPEKAQVHLIRALATLRAHHIDAGVLIVGEGSERANLEKEIKRLRLQDYVVLMGEQRDVRPYLAQMDVFALTSTGVETFSNAALEAMAVGLPVVTSRVGGMEELIAFGGGLSYAPGDVRMLTDTLRDLLQDTGRRQKMATAARRAVVTHFTWPQMVERFLALLPPARSAPEEPPSTER